MSNTLPLDLAQALDYERLRSWLQSKPRSVPVGTSCDACQCPLAQYLREAGLSEVEISEDLIYFDEGSYDLPRWARFFISNIDRQGRYVQIQPDIALKLLDKALGEDAQAEYDR